MKIKTRKAFVLRLKIVHSDRDINGPSRARYENKDKEYLINGIAHCKNSIVTEVNKSKHCI